MKPLNAPDSKGDNDTGHIFGWLARWIVRHPKSVLSLWLVVLILASIAATGLPAVLKSGGFEVPDSESARAAESIRNEFTGQPAHTILLVFKSADLTVDQPEYRTAVEVLARELIIQSDITSRVLTAYNTGNPLFTSRDKHTSFAVVPLATSDADKARDLVPKVREIGRRAELSSQLTIQVTGGPAVAYDLARVAAEDLPKAEQIGLPITLLTLIFVFGALVAAGLPLLVGVSSIVVVMGIAFILGQNMELSSFIQNIVPMLGLGVGIDYCLFMVSRFREELASGRSKEEAVVRTVARAGRAIAFSGGTVAIGLSALLVPNLMILRSVGLGGILVVTVSVVSALTLLPALLVLLGERVNAPRFLSLRMNRKRARTTGFWQRWAENVMRHPVTFLVAVVVILGLLATPSLRMNTLAPGATLLPSEAESREAFEALTQSFSPGEMSPINVIVDTGRTSGLWNDKIIADLYTLTQTLQRDSRVARVESLVSFDPRANLENYQSLYRGGFDPSRAPQVAPAVLPLIAKAGKTTLLQVVPSVDPDSLEARELVETIRKEIITTIN